MAKAGKMVLAVAVLFGACGCGNSDRDEAERNLALWKQKGPASYVYIVETSCFCEPLGPVRVVVEDGGVKSATAITPGFGTPTGKSMTELLENVVKTAGRDNSSYEARFDPTLGYLKYERVDRDSNTSDDEFTTQVTCLGEGTGDDVCPG